MGNLTDVNIFEDEVEMVDFFDSVSVEESTESSSKTKHCEQRNNSMIIQEGTPKMDKSLKLNDNEDIFGIYVASEMRQLKNPANKRKLKRLINEAIMQVSDLDASEWESSTSSNVSFQNNLSTQPSSSTLIFSPCSSTT
ncbi:hypothetical protein X975_09670, partial [Stegodyphus mimosarum]